MARVRVSTTVDGELLAQARGLRRNTTDGALIDEALTALVERYRSGEMDQGDSDDDHAPDEPDGLADLASFRQAAARS